MDLLDIIKPLPPTNEVKRLIEFCLSDLKAQPTHVVYLLRRAQRFADAVATLGGEARHEECEQRRRENFDERTAILAKLNACLDTPVRPPI